MRVSGAIGFHAQHDHAVAFAEKYAVKTIGDAKRRAGQ